MSQTDKVPFKAFLPIILIFAVVGLAAILLKEKLLLLKVDQPFLLYGNLLLFTVTLVSWIFHSKAINAGNIQAFLRGVYSAMLLKLFVCIIAFFIYVSLAGSDVNKPALFSVMFLYLLYTFTELSILIKNSKPKQ